MTTNEEIIAYQKAIDEFRSTPIGRAFFKYENVLITAWRQDTEDSFTDKNRTSTKEAFTKLVEAKRELLTLLNAPDALTKEMP